MNKLLASVAAAALVAACGGSGNDDDNETTTAESSIVGSWGVELSSGCVLGFTATSNEYEADVLCSLQNGTLGAEAERGNYSIEGSTITMTPTVASCPTSDHSPDMLGFKVSGRHLTLSQPAGVLVMERINEPASGSAVVAYGCVDLESGQFTQHDLEPL